MKLLLGIEVLYLIDVALQMQHDHMVVTGMKFDMTEKLRKFIALIGISLKQEIENVNINKHMNGYLYNCRDKTFLLRNRA